MDCTNRPKWEIAILVSKTCPKVNNRKLIHIRIDFFLSDKPGFLDFKGKAKWEAWNKIKGMTTADAQTAYITKVKSLIASLGLKS